MPIVGRALNVIRGGNALPGVCTKRDVSVSLGLNTLCPFFKDTEEQEKIDLDGKGPPHPRQYCRRAGWAVQSDTGPPWQLHLKDHVIGVLMKWRDTKWFLLSVMLLSRSLSGLF